MVRLLDLDVRDKREQKLRGPYLITYQISEQQRHPDRRKPFTGLRLVGCESTENRCAGMAGLPMKMLLVLITMWLRAGCLVEAFQLINTSPGPQVRTIQGRDLPLLCQADEPFQFCVWTIMSDTGNVTCQISSNLLHSQPFCKDPNGDHDDIEWMTNERQCGIVIHSVSRKHTKSALCLMYSTLKDQSIRAEFVIDVTVLSMVTMSLDNDRELVVQAYKPFYFACSATAGHPEPILLASMSSDVSPSSNLSQVAGIVLSAIQREAGDDLDQPLSRTFSGTANPYDNGKVVKCEALQDGVSGADRSVTYRRLKVLFAPIKLDDEPLSYHYRLGWPETRLSVIFRANPPPTDTQVMWHVVPASPKIPSSESKVLHAGNSSEPKYEALSLFVNHTTVEAVLIIRQLSRLDQNFLYQLKVKTELGEASFNISLVEESGSAGLSEHDEGHAEGGHDVSDGGHRSSGEQVKSMASGAIIGVIILIVLGAAAIMVMVYLKKKKMYCFAPTPEPRMADHDSKPDSSSEREPLDDKSKAGGQAAPTAV